MAEAAPAALARYREAVTREMQDTLRLDTRQVYDAQRYHLGWQSADGSPAAIATGKMFRPALCLLSCEAVGGDFQRALPAAAAIEFLHNFSLIHDDIEDGGHTRHGRRTIWDLWGIPHGINAGDSMFVVARLALHRLAGQGYAAQTVLNAFLLFDRACQRLCEGQDMDLRFEERESVEMEEYLRMIAGKTGSLIGTSAALGAMLGGASAQTVVLFDRFGRLLGRAFQIQDDVLGVWGVESSTGKPSGDDIRSRKKSYPIVRALETVPPSARSRLLALYGGEHLDERGVDDVIAIFNEQDIRSDAVREARAVAASAAALIRDAALVEPVGRELLALTEFVVAREA